MFNENQIAGAVAAFPSTNIAMNRILECAVILNWSDLMKTSEEGLIHLECRTESGRYLDYLKIWSSETRGYWNLVSEYWMCDSSAHVRGLTFFSGINSEGLTQMLGFIMQNQNIFSTSSDSYSNGLIQVYPPTEEDQTRAMKVMNEFFAPGLHSST